jgi:hypothetical protein
MGMGTIIVVEVIGFSDSTCGPFPCGEHRSCELEKCAPSEELPKAVEALKERVSGIYGDRVAVSLTLLDDGIPDYISAIIEERHPPIPIVLVNGKVTPLGRISLPLLAKEIEKYLD